MYLGTAPQCVVGCLGILSPEELICLNVGVPWRPGGHTTQRLQPTSLPPSLTLTAPPLSRPAFSQLTPSTTSSLVQHMGGTPQFQKITLGGRVYLRSWPRRCLDKYGWCNPSKRWLGSRCRAFAAGRGPRGE